MTLTKEKMKNQLKKVGEKARRVYTEPNFKMFAWTAAGLVGIAVALVGVVKLDQKAWELDRQRTEEMLQMLKGQGVVWVLDPRDLEGLG